MTHFFFLNSISLIFINTYDLYFILFYFILFYIYFSKLVLKNENVM